MQIVKYIYILHCELNFWIELYKFSCFSNEVIETDMDPELMLQILARLGQSMLRNQELER